MNHAGIMEARRDGRGGEEGRWGEGGRGIRMNQGAVAWETLHFVTGQSVRIAPGGRLHSGLYDALAEHEIPPNHIRFSAPVVCEYVERGGAVIHDGMDVAGAYSSAPRKARERGRATSTGCVFLPSVKFARKCFLKKTDTHGTWRLGGGKMMNLCGKTLCGS